MFQSLSMYYVSLQYPVPLETAISLVISILSLAYIRLRSIVYHGLGQLKVYLQRA